MSWLKLHHKMKNWGWIDDPNMVALWIRILLEANMFPQERHGQMYEEGSFPTSLDKLSTDTGMSVRTVRTCLERLKKSGEIVIESTKKGTKIKVVKWPEYQGSSDDYDMLSDTQTDKQVTNNRQTSDKQPTILKESIDIKKEKKVKKIPIEVVDGSPEFTEAFDALLEVRKAKKVPNTDRAVKQIMNKLNTLAPNNESKQIELLNTAVERGWSTVFEPHTTNTTQQERKGLSALMETTYD